MRTVGIDPGLGGALAAYEYHEGDLLGPKRGTERVVDVIDMPVRAEGKRVDAREVRRFIQTHHPDHVFIEAVNSMPSIPDKRTGLRRSMGAATSEKFMRAASAVEVVCEVMEVPYTMVRSQTWKATAGLSADKKASLRLVRRRFKKAGHWFTREGDDGRAEALLIAMYGADKMMTEKRFEALEALECVATTSGSSPQKTRRSSRSSPESRSARRARTGTHSTAKAGAAGSVAP